MKITVAIALMLTFSVALAGPIQPNPKDNQPSGGPPPDSESTMPLKPMDVAKPPPPKPSEGATFFYPFDEELTLAPGLVAFAKTDGTQTIVGMFGVGYLFQSLTSFHWDSGLEFNASGDGNIWVAGRNILYATERFRPFYSLGLGLQMRSERGLANILSINNYYFRGAGGAEYSVSQTASLKIEVFGGMDLTGRWLAGGFFGITRGF